MGRVWRPGYCVRDKQACKQVGKLAGKQAGKQRQVGNPGMERAWETGRGIERETG